MLYMCLYFNVHVLCVIPYEGGGVSGWARSKENRVAWKHTKNNLLGKMSIALLLGVHISESFCGDVCIRFGNH
jgi:hypothetical protein